MSSTSRAELARALMAAFAQRTGLSPARPGRRYLWTDAFAVQNFLTLGHELGDTRQDALALALIDSVHDTLGRPAPGTGGPGWLGASDEADAHAHPTRGGLRIGKPRSERAPGEPLDEAAEWDRDGQYFHDLIQWMRALDQAASWLGRPELNVWARELALTAHAAFAYGPRGRGTRRLYWKMSVDLSRPLVTSMGQHDALDALVTYAQLEHSAARLRAPTAPSLADILHDASNMVDPRDWWTAEPLGLGTLLLDAVRALELTEDGAFPQTELVAPMLAAGLDGLAAYAERNVLRAPAGRRLAFRELGLAIGLRAVAHVETRASWRRLPSGLRPLVDGIARHAAVGTSIESFWLDPRHRGATTWTEHRDINDVMLATSLSPEALVSLDGPSSVASFPLKTGS